MDLIQVLQTGCCTLTILWLAGASLVAGVIKNGFGVGAGALLTPVLVFFLPPVQAFAVVALVLAISNLSILARSWQEVDWHLALLIGPAALLATTLGTRFVLQAPGPWLARWVGIATIAFAALRLARLHAPPRPLPRYLAPVAGLICGILNAFSAGAGVALGAYLVAQGLARARFIATAAALLGVLDAWKLWLLWRGGAMAGATLWWILVAVLLSAMGGTLGERLTRMVSDRQYHVALQVLILVSGMGLLLR